MVWLKFCPNCKGDLYRDRDTYGTYISCMQCSHYLTQAEEATIGLSTDTLELQMMAQVELELVAA